MSEFLDAGVVFRRMARNAAADVFNLIRRLEAEGVPLTGFQQVLVLEAALDAYAGLCFQLDGLEGRKIPTVRKAPSAALRAAVLERDGHRCVACGSTEAPLHCDHVLPVAHGGETVLDNLQTLCATCNLGKSVDAVRYVGPV